MIKWSVHREESVLEHARNRGQYAKEGAPMDYKLIPLSRGLSAKVDSEDYDWLMQWKWYAVQGHKSFYAVRCVNTPVKVHYKMHREIMKAAPGSEVDHANHDTLDNRRSNLRVTTKTLNQGNMSNTQTGTSKYKGVSWHPNNKNWMARIRNQHLGSFKSEKEAALQYDRAALETYGESAFLNFPEEIETTRTRSLLRPVEATKARVGPRKRAA